MDKLNKAILKIPEKQRRDILASLKQIRKGDLKDLDVKKLKNMDRTFRDRVGSYRIIFSDNKAGPIMIKKIAKRDDRTY